ncbi:MAG: cytochrome C [Acidobacteria bacterium]|nr:MAG: cytochrome C [Acidobacteriota bacterium]
MRSRFSLAAAAAALLISVGARLTAQGPPAQPPTPAPAGQAPATAQPPGGGRGRGQATFPAQQRAPGDPAVIQRGKTLYEINCRLCHGADLRGGDMGGVNLLRSPLVLNDEDGELILPVVQTGRQNPGMPVMPPFPLPPDDVKAIAEYIHSVVATARPQGAPPAGAEVALNIVVGDAKAGAAYFASKCASCHSATGDLQGIASRVSEPMQLQNLWVAGIGGGGGRGGRGTAAGAAPTEASSRRPVTVAVTTADGQRVQGRLDRIDDFIVTLTSADGLQRTFRRVGDVPKVEITDPLDGHKKLFVQYTDKDIHDVTAYLVTLK